MHCIPVSVRRCRYCNGTMVLPGFEELFEARPSSERDGAVKYAHGFVRIRHVCTFIALLIAFL